MNASAAQLISEIPLTERWTPLRPHKVQLAYRDSPSRFNVVPAGRRSGKTERAKRKMVKLAIGWDKPWAFRGACCAPTYGQARAIYWEDIKALVPKWLVKPGGISETHMCITLVNGSQIWVIGMDKPERIEGRPWDYIILDEYANMKKEAWGANVRPALSDRLGHCDLIGVPEGRNHYYDTYKYAVQDRSGEWGAYHWLSSEILPASEVESAKRDLDALTFQQEYEGSFVTFAGMAYYAFNEKDHYAKCKHLYDKKQPLIFTFDFNVSPGVANVFQELPHPKYTTKSQRQKAKSISLCMGEVHIPRNSNTPSVCKKLRQDWKGHLGRVICYGDATGGASGSAKVAGSDWDLIRRELKKTFGDRVQYKVRKANPAERSRVNSVNSRLKTSSGEVRMVFDPEHCKYSINDFEGTRVLEGGSGELDKKYDPVLTHHSDGVGYYIEREYPVRKIRSSSEDLKL